MPFINAIRLLALALLLTLEAASSSTVLYDDSRGLSNNHVMQVVKDKTGLLWIATQSGLNTFDGYSFKESPEFKNTRINALCYDSVSHLLWVGTPKGLFRISLWNSQVIDYTLLLHQKNVIELFMYNNLLYVVFFHGSVISINRDNKARPVFGIKSLGLKTSYIGKHITHNGKGELYFTINGFDYPFRLNLVSGKTTLLRNDGFRNMAGMISLPEYCFVSAKNGNLLALDSPCMRPSPAYSFYNTSTRISIIHQYQDEYYASSRDQYGVFIFNQQRNAWDLVKTDESVSFKSKIITCIFRDPYNTLWVGTNKGLIKIDTDKKKLFNVLFDGYSPPVSNRQIVEKNRNEFFIATYFGIYYYPLNNKAILIDSNKNDSVFPLYTRALLYDNEYLYGGTESHSSFFFRVNLKSMKYEGYFFKTITEGEQVGAVYGMLKDHNDIIWLATDVGLASYNKRTATTIVHANDKFSVNGTRLFYMVKSKIKNKFWAAGRNAFYLIDEDNGVEKKFTFDAFSRQLVADDYIFIGEDAGNKLWIGTKKSGIIIFDPNSMTSERVNRAEGLSSNEVYSIIWQNDSIGWISTANGLCRYNRGRRTFNNYFYENGLSDNEFNQNSFLKSANGNLYFGGINGINYFNPETIADQNTSVTLFLASVVKWNQDMQTFNDANSEGGIFMSPQDHLLTFTFGLSDFSQTEGNSYFYRIKGLYDDWVSLGNQNILRLEGLPAGNYTVQIIGYNKNGIRTSNTLTYSIEIVQVFYKTWWFYVLVALGVVLLVYGYFKWRLHNINQQLKLRTQIASNLHDEVGSLLTSIIISTDSARYSSVSSEEKNNKLEKIASLSRDATNTMSDVLWSIDARNDYAGILTDRMREHAEAMLMPLDVDVAFDFTGTQQHQNIEPDTRQQLYLIFKESINNIVKHGKASQVKVIYAQQGKKFRLTVENDIRQDDDDYVAYKGQGLKNMEMRAGKIQAKCECVKHPGSFKVIISSL